MNYINDRIAMMKFAEVKAITDRSSSLLSSVKNESNLSYYMTVNLTLIPADTKPEDMGKINCQISADKIKRYGAEVFGLQNPILPLLKKQKQQGGKGKRTIKKNKKVKSKKI